ncbi:MAG: hypothetical protein ABIW85_08985 [Variovorax sp.]
MNYKLITEHQLQKFHDLIQRQGWRAQDFELQEDAFDPQKAEVEAALGEVGVRCLANQSVEVYPLDAGDEWLALFSGDLQSGKFGRPRGTD